MFLRLEKLLGSVPMIRNNTSTTKAKEIIPVVKLGYNFIITIIESGSLNSVDSNRDKWE